LAADLRGVVRETARVASLCNLGSGIIIIIIIIIITYFISCWQNAAKQYVVIVKLVKIKKEEKCTN